MTPNLSADIFCDANGKNWSAVIYRHPADGGDGIEIWRKDNLRSQYAAEISMEAAWKRLIRK